MKCENFSRPHLIGNRNCLRKTFCVGSFRLRYGNFFSERADTDDFSACSFPTAILTFLSRSAKASRLGRLAEILENPHITKIFHNAKFDLEFLRENGYQAQNVFCTMIAEKVLTRGAGQSVSLAETLYRYFAVDLDKSQRAKFTKNWNGVWTEELVNYALSDVVYLPELMREQTLWLERLGLSGEFARQMSKIC